MASSSGPWYRSHPKKLQDLKTEYFTEASGDGFDLPVVWTLPADFGRQVGRKKYPVIFRHLRRPDAGTLHNEYRDHTNNALLNKGVIHYLQTTVLQASLGKKGLGFYVYNLGKMEIIDYSKGRWMAQKAIFIDNDILLLKEEGAMEDIWLLWL